ncbi:MAG TPA: hypothetical protein VE782_04135 [Myxococcaceae bacterium]|nr:hypothetical protein [Myxococcaceae bacterium]
MPPRGVKSPKRKRQYERIKESSRSRGESPRRAKEIAARTVNKQRRKAGETGGGQKKRASASSGKSRRTTSTTRRPTRRTGSARGRGRRSS